MSGYNILFPNSHFPKGINFIFLSSILSFFSKFHVIIARFLQFNSLLALSKDFTFLDLVSVFSIS